MGDLNPLDRKFRTLFEGDEIDGKFYPLDGGVTKLDAFTSEFLLLNGRIEEVDDDTFEKLGKPYRDGETAADRKGKGAKAPADEIDRALKARLEAAAEKFNKGEIPADLIDASKPETDADRLITKAKLLELAGNEGVEAKGNKVEIATAIMAKRAETAGE